MKLSVGSDIISIVWLIISYSVFIVSYFPQKLSKSDLSKSDNDHFQMSKQPHGCDKIVLMVIDALRFDFVSDDHSALRSTRRFLNDGHGILFTAKVNPPTVTLPRIKAMTTGTVPGFIDVILNFGSQSLQEDNIVSRLIQHNKNMVFYGDDTWLKLFPQQFLREDGTTSFFVSDYTEVDNNVTRHLPSELDKDDWTMMILHYLGLDHIGHMAGPKSPLIQPKLEEMDGIIEMIFNKLSVQNKDGKSSMLIICGDHGMSDQGGHGGASHSETTVPILVLYPNKNTSNFGVSNKEILQIDLAPTLAVINNVPIPVNNLGTVILDVIDDYNMADKVDIMYSNAKQIAALLEYNDRNYENNAGYILYLQTKDRHHALMESKYNITDAVWEKSAMFVIDSYKQCIGLMTEVIKKSSTTYDLHGMFISILLIWLILIMLIFRPSNMYMMSYSVLVICCSILVFSQIVVCTSQYASLLLCSYSTIQSVLSQLIVFTGIIFSVHNINQLFYNPIKFQQHWLKPDNVLEWFLLLGTILHTISYISSSFVEEEHQTWYYYIVTFYIIILYKIIQHAGMMYLERTAKTDKNGANLQYSLVIQNFGTLQPICLNPKKLNSKKSMVQSNEGSENKNENTTTKRNLMDGASSQENASAIYKTVMSVIIVLVLLRMLRCWNQTGNKWLDIPDVGDWLVRSENKMVLTVISIVCLCCLVVIQYNNIIHTLLVLGSFISTYLYRCQTEALYNLFITSTSNGSFEARLSYLFILLLLLECVYGYWTRTSDVINKIQTIWIVLIVLLARPHNLCVVTMIVIVEILSSVFIIPHIKLTIPYLTVYYYWMAQASFFYQGNSNSLTTIDVSAGYIGLNSYQPVLTAVLLFCSTYSCVIFWFLSLVKYILTDTVRRCKESLYKSAITMMCIKSLPIAVYTILVTALRYHLFVWTVFSPKLLYEGVLLLLVSTFSVILLVISSRLSDNTVNNKQQ